MEMIPKKWIEKNLCDVDFFELKIRDSKWRRSVLNF